MSGLTLFPLLKWQNDIGLCSWPDRSFRTAGHALFAEFRDDEIIVNDKAWRLAAAVAEVGCPDVGMALKSRDWLHAGVEDDSKVAVLIVEE